MTKKTTSPKNNEEKIYEIGYHIISSVSEENLSKEVEKIKAVLTKENASIITEEAPKLRPLAYEIKKAFGGQYKKFDKAYFGWVKFELPEGGDVNNIDKALKFNESVLRFILIKTVRENTMYSPKISVFTDKEPRQKTYTKPEKVEKTEKEVKPISIEEIDKSIDELVADETKI